MVVGLNWGKDGLSHKHVLVVLRCHFSYNRSIYTKVHLYSPNVHTSTAVQSKIVSLLEDSLCLLGMWTTNMGDLLQTLTLCW